MNQTTEAGIAVVCMLAMFGLGTWVSSNTYKVEEDGLTHQNINFTGEIYRGGYLFNFTEKIEDGTGITGRTWPRGSNYPEKVLIKTNRPAEKILETCRHELLHHYFPEYRHPDFSKSGVSRSNDPIYRLDDKVDFEVCEDVTATALQHQR